MDEVEGIRVFVDIHVVVRCPLAVFPRRDVGIVGIQVDGDMVLLSTDGLHGVLDDGSIAGVLATHGDDLVRASQALIDAANAAGGPDNIAVALARVSS